MGTSIDISVQPGSSIAIAAAATSSGAGGALSVGPQSPVSERVRVDEAIAFSADGDWMLHCASCGVLAVKASSDASRLIRQVSAPRTPWRVLDRAPLRSGGDFLVWHNTQTGELQLWSTSLLHPLSGTNYGPAQARSVGTADFDGDGSSELLIEDMETGEISLWGLYSGRLMRVAAITGPARARLVAARDFDRNGTIDLLWQNSLGLVRTWSVLRDPKRGLLYAASGPTELVPVGNEIVDSGDYDGDGHLDLLSRSQYDGHLTISYLIGGVRDETVLVRTRGDDASQRIVGSADLNGVPGDEIVLQNEQTGAIAVQVSPAVRYLPLQPDPAWSLAPVRG